MGAADADEGLGVQGRKAHRENPTLQSQIAFTLILALVSLAPRLYVAIAWAREPVWDGHYYDYGAQRIASGLGYSDDLVVGGQTEAAPMVSLSRRIQRVPRRDLTACSALVRTSLPSPMRSRARSPWPSFIGWRCTRPQGPGTEHVWLRLSSPSRRALSRTRPS